MTVSLVTVRSVGGVLPGDLLQRVIAGDRTLPGLTGGDYHLGAGETPREAANRAWSYLTGVWASYTAARQALPAGDRAVGLTRERWLLPMLRELGYGRVPVTPAGGLAVDGRAFPVSHRWERLPAHLLGWGVDLDRRTPGLAGAAERAPQAMVQELLNRADDYLWAIVSNGRVLRLLRDSTSLVGQAYVEFDLEAMFDGEVFSDFVVLYLLAHQSRVEILTGGAGATDCWLERWREEAERSGTRAMGALRDGVKTAVEALGSGFLAHPDNVDLHRQVADGTLPLADVHRALLRIVYRLLFAFVAEDRDGLHSPDADPQARDRYARYFSTARLRRLALRRRGDRHTDLWAALTLVTDGLGRDGGLPELGLPALGGLFETGPQDVLAGWSLPNQAFLTGVRQLSVVQPKGELRRTVDYRNLGAEELGSIYESLLELHPRYDPVLHTFSLDLLAGNERKTSGSYYTPSALIALVLDTALDPLLDEAAKADDPQAALLALTVCDPACGSGHFLVAAARRIADRLAITRTGDLEPTPTDLQAALHDVVARCIYGVDLNPMAAELAKVSLWLEALQPGRPLGFLDAHIKVGNSLLGTTPALLAAGLPDEAFAPLSGDDKAYATALRRRNRAEREADPAQDALFGTEGIDVTTGTLADDLAEVDGTRAGSLADVHVQAKRYAATQHSPHLVRARRVADAWCAAFVQDKRPGQPAITHATLRDLAERTDTVPAAATRMIDTAAADYRLFHWHLEFPQVFTVPDDGPAGDTTTGWHGGFACVVGNPPWERIRLQEQEFFAARDPDIASAPTAAKRKKLIAALPATNPTVAVAWAEASRHSEGQSLLVRESGRYPFCGRGDINTYSIFAETFRTLIAPTGQAGVITPTGLATDNTTAPFFADLLATDSLVAFYDFENEAKIFPGVHNQFRFATTCMTGSRRHPDRVRLAFYTRFIADVPARRFDLTADEIRLLNPNTGTLPVFRARADAEITLGVFRQHPVLIRDGGPVGNPWGMAFMRMFDMANDSELFRTDEDLRDATFDGWAYRRDGPTRLPLYEAKLLGHWDHRHSTYADATQAQLNKGTLPRLDGKAHEDADREPLARYWVAAAEVDKALAGRWDRGWLLGWRDIARASDARTFVPCVLPRSAVGHKFPLAFPVDPTHGLLLHAVWSSFAFDYIARQKISGTGMTYFLVKQLACPTPATFAEPAAFDPSVTLGAWIRPRVLELSYTSWRIQPYAVDNGDDGPPYRWDPARREIIRADLDAAMFHVYGLTRPEVEHVMDSFFVVRKYDERDHGEFRTKRMIMERCGALADAATTGTPYRSPLDPPPGHGPRHPDRAGP